MKWFDWVFVVVMVLLGIVICFEIWGPFHRTEVGNCIWRYNRLVVADSAPDCPQSPVPGDPQVIYLPDGRAIKLRGWKAPPP
jgi:hypothetical protein